MSQAAMTNDHEFFLNKENLTPENTVDMMRSRMYSLLALAFSFPDKKLLFAQTELWELAATFCPEMGVSREVENVISKEMESEYINVFDGHEQKKYCKPYEGLWKEADRAKQQWEVKKFYQFFGLGLNREINEMPDHIMHELEFMHFLSYRMIETDHGVNAYNKIAELNQPEHYLRAQKDFLERHLHTWVDKFSLLLQEKTDIAFYDQLARVTAQFIKDDLEWVQEQIEAMDEKKL